MSIVVKNITKKFGEQLALNNISFEVETGNIVGFLGPNGAGKTTMMKILTGFISATSGEAFINNKKIESSSIELRKFIGYLPENNPLYTDMYIKEYLHFVGNIYKVNNLAKRVAEVVDLIGLTLEQRKKISQLSKGYKQRVGLAAALIHNPSVLILDEPTSGLDPNQIVEIRKIIYELGKDKTVLLSTHIMQEVEAICEKVIIINNGKIVANDTTNNIKNKIKQNSYQLTVEFDKKADITELAKIKYITNIDELPNNQYVIDCDKDKETREEIFAFAVKTNIALISIQKKEQSLEELFYQLTR